MHYLLLSIFLLILVLLCCFRGGSQSERADKVVNVSIQVIEQDDCRIISVEGDYEWGDAILNVFYYHDVTYRLNSRCADAWNGLFTAFMTLRDPYLPKNITFD